MDWRNIPSLAALRAFEAAARCRSYSAAARELNVTHAAIAQHVRSLEATFARPLMVRDGASMAPTEEGARLAIALSDGFQRIAEGIAELTQAEEDRSLRIATTPSFAENWLVPRIARFWEAHPGIGLEIVPSSTTINLRDAGFDLALRYGKGDWPGLEAEALLKANMSVVAAPGLIDPPRVDDLRHLADKHWFLLPERREEFFWLREQGLDPEKAAHHTV